MPTQAADRDQKDGPYPYYGASGVIDCIDDYIFEGERLLIGEDGANLIARASPIAFMARGKYWVNNHAHVVASNGKAELRYLEFVLENMARKPCKSGTAQPKLNRKKLDRIRVPAPPVRLQRIFVDRTSQLARLEMSHKRALSDLDSLFASLQQRAFRGEL